MSEGLRFIPACVPETIMNQQAQLVGGLLDPQLQRQATSATLEESHGHAA